jgi:hypothetical protein
MLKNLQIVKVERDPKELHQGVPAELADVHEILPPPSRFPNFIVDFIYDGTPTKMEMALELDGRDADWNDPEGVDWDAMPELSAEIMNAIYASKPYEQAVKALEAST